MGTFRQQMITIATVLAIFAAEPSVSRSVNISSSWLLPQNEFPVFYRHFRDRVTWFEADAVCQFHHAQLATVESNSQFEAIRSYLKELDVIDNVWIGLKRNSEASEFTWTNYQPLARSGYFREEVPRSSDPVCVVTDPTANFKWHSLHCGGPEVASFVCELPVPYWASKSNGCMTSMMEGMTVTFLPERPAIQLTKECGPGVSKNVTCKGNMKQSDILEKLSCPNSNKLQMKYQLKPTKPILPDIMYKTTTSSSESDVEDYAIEMATITQYNDETFQSISKVMGRGGNNGGMINLPQEMSIALEPIKSAGRGGFDTNGIDSAFMGAAPVETTSSTTTNAPSSTTTAPKTTEKITFWPTAKTTRTAATFSATTSTTAAAATSTAGVTTTSTTTTTTSTTAPITTRRPVPSTTVSSTSSTSTAAAAVTSTTTTTTTTTATAAPAASSSTGTRATVTTMRATTEKPTTTVNRIVPTAARPPAVNRPAAAYEFGTPVATAAHGADPATVTFEPAAITTSPADTTQSTTTGKIHAAVTPFGAAPIRVYKKIDLPSSLQLPAAVNFDDDDDADEADEDDSPYRPVGRANGTLAVTTAAAVAAGKKTNGTSTVVTGKTTTTTERAIRPTTTAIPPKKTVATTTSTEAVTATATAAVITESASPNAPNVSADSLDDNNWNPPTAASASSAAPQTVTASGAAGTPVAVDVTAAAAAITDTVTNTVTTTNAAATAAISTSTTVTAASTAAATVNNRRKVNNYDAYTEHPNRNRHIVRPKQQHHHSYPYILYRLLG